jgi:hypothetical protein
MDATIDTTTQDKGSLCKVGALAGLGAGIATGVIGAVASAIDVPLNVGGNEVPVGAFFGSAFVAVLAGTGVAAVLARKDEHPARAFAAIAVIVTLFSLGGPLSADAETATRVTLVLAHLAAATVAIPVIARRLARRRS